VLSEQLIGGQGRRRDTRGKEVRLKVAFKSRCTFYVGCIGTRTPYTQLADTTSREERERHDMFEEGPGQQAKGSYVAV
jgi:hypothetical protein